MSDSCILAVDQGTTSSRAIIFSHDARILAVAQQEFTQHYPQPGWVEHDPEDIWASTLKVCRQAVREAKDRKVNIVGIGITNQRETTLVWDKNTGKAIYNAIVWQDRRTAKLCRSLQEQGHLSSVQSRTGLLLDPYFSASKIAWILDNVEGARAKAERGELAFGTIDSFLIWRLTGGKVHATDVTNASRTSLFNIHDLTWDEQLLDIFTVPDTLLPQVNACNADYGQSARELFDISLPILGVAGDQQAAAIGQCCFSPGSSKSTYGTGCFVLLNTGEQAVSSKNKLLTTLAYQIGDTLHYALEGSIFIAGAAVQWLRDGIQIIDNAAQTGPLAADLDHDHGVYLVPAFAGMGAPHWQPDARGAIYGLTRGTNQAHLARAALESVAYQSADLFAAMGADGMQPAGIRVDGGMIANDWLGQFLADMLNVPVQRPVVMETTALGAAYLAGLQAGLYPSMQALQDKNKIERTFKPNMEENVRKRLLQGWQKAVQSTLNFAE